MLLQIGELRSQLGRAKGECEGAIGQRLASEEVLQLERKVGGPGGRRRGGGRGMPVEAIIFTSVSFLVPIPLSN